MFLIGGKDKGISLSHRVHISSVMYVDLPFQHIAELLPFMGLVRRHGLAGLDPHQNRLHTPALGRGHQPFDPVAVLVCLLKIVFFGVDYRLLTFLLKKLRQIGPQALHNVH